MPAAFKSLGVLYTKRCPLECAHCVTESGPSAEGKLDVERAVHVIELIGPFVGRVALTGGEPLLYPEEIAEVVERTSHRFFVHVVTGAFWAKSERRTEEILGRLRSAGLGHISISWDPWHAEFIDARTFLRGLDAALAKGFQVAVVLGGSQQDWRESGILRELEQRGVGINPQRLSFTGRAATSLQLASNEPVEDRGCAGYFHLSVDWEGILRVCCGPSLAAGPGSALYLGKLGEDDLVAAVERARRDPALAGIAVLGPRVLARRAGRARLPVMQETSEAPCATCLGLFQDAAAVTRLREALRRSGDHRRIVAAVMADAARRERERSRLPPA
ncbi:MAG: radical SAM protein [Deltaproteobacteria bacterium]|nr:MAG: radical SAM protein [Deltaproteobacteria bacterium]